MAMSYMTLTLGRDKGIRFYLLRGGSGGKGNCHFATASHRTPRHATRGNAGQMMDVVLEMKLIADVGLVGVPNVGKSTFLSALTNARTKVGDYAFTTLRPHLGSYVLDIERSLVLADLPGIVKGGALGKRIGIGFFASHRTHSIFVLYDRFDVFESL